MPFADDEEVDVWENGGIWGIQGGKEQFGDIYFGGILTFWPSHAWERLDFGSKLECAYLNIPDPQRYPHQWLRS